MTTTPEAGMRLAPCPFCGGPARLMDMTKRATKLGYQYVECKACGVDVGSVSAWNTRAAAPVPPAGGEGEVEGFMEMLRQMGPCIFNGRSISYEALAARAQPPVGEAVAWRVKNGKWRIFDARDEAEAFVVRTGRALEIHPLYAHPAEPAARLGSSAAPIPTEQADGPVVAAEEPEHASGCGYTGRDFGASYPDSICIDGYLWDLDSCDEPGQGLTQGGDIPCPKCNHEGAVQ